MSQPIYQTGSHYSLRGIQYWIIDRETRCFRVMRRLQWSSDLANEIGVMYPTPETIKASTGHRGPWHRRLGEFTLVEDRVITIKEAAL